MFASPKADLVRTRSVLDAPGASVFVQSCYNHRMKIKQAKSEEKTGRGGF
jgi:hypothetical protein